MPRYIKQRESTTCGPVAILNALKWSGAYVTERSNLKQIKELCHWSKYKKDMINNRITRGSTVPNVFRALKNFSYVNSEKVIAANVRNIEKELKQGKSVIIRWYWANNAGHFVFCPGMTDDGDFIIVNKGGKTIETMTKNQLRKRLSFKSNTVCYVSKPVAIVVERRIQRVT